MSLSHAMMHNIFALLARITKLALRAAEERGRTKCVARSWQWRHSRALGLKPDSTPKPSKLTMATIHQSSWKMWHRKPRSKQRPQHWQPRYRPRTMQGLAAKQRATTSEVRVHWNRAFTLAMAPNHAASTRRTDSQPAKLQISQRRSKCVPKVDVAKSQK